MQLFVVHGPLFTAFNTSCFQRIILGCIQKKTLNVTIKINVAFVFQLVILRTVD